MNTCWNCRKKFEPGEIDECPNCGSGLIESDNEDFIDFISEYDSDGF